MKIGFVLLSSSKKPQPSTRIAVLNMLPFLHGEGIQAELVFDPEHESEVPNLNGLAQRLISEKFDCVYFQKVHGASVQACVRDLSKAGIVTIHGVCDLVDVEMAQLVDLALVPTEFMKSLYPIGLQDKIRVVHDGIESPDERKQEWGDQPGSCRNPLRAVLVTSSNLHRLPVLLSPPSWLSVTIVGRYPPAGDWKQRFRESRWAFQKMGSLHERLAHLGLLVHPRIKTEMWDAKSVYLAMQNADIGIIPIERPSELAKGTSVPIWQVKSENRLTLKMAFGLPVVATPIPSYESVMESGKNGFFADSRADWLRNLEILRDPAARREIGNLARASVVGRYSVQEQARRLVEALQSVIVQGNARHRCLGKLCTSNLHVA
jgi:glycosyltransferase involved in cell wall biosynthesis